MSPTLVGRHRLANCPNCETQFRVPARMEVREGKPFPCWHCGLQIPGLQTASFAGDVVRIAPIDTEHGPVVKNDLVAVRRKGLLRVKRVIGLPNETIELVGNRLFVSGHSPNIGRLIPVDQDSLREVSRWVPRNQSRWKRDNRTWRSVQSESAGLGNRSTLVYQHVNVYRGNSPELIRDDYPGNVRLSRELAPVHDLVWTANVGWDSQPKRGNLAIQFWTPTGIRMATTAIPDEFTTLVLRSAESDDVSSSSETQIHVGPTHPISVSVPIGAVLSGIVIERQIEFRLRPTDDRSGYPLKLGSSQYYVVGDNVPVSADSREWGPIAEDQIVGRISLD